MQESLDPSLINHGGVMHVDKHAWGFLQPLVLDQYLSVSH